MPTLDAYAFAVPAWSGTLCTALDARKQEVYAAVYGRDLDRIVRFGEPRALTAVRLATELAAMVERGDTAAIHLVGDGAEAYAHVFRDAIAGAVTVLASDEHPPRASATARLAAARLARDPAGDDLVTLVPEYLRPPEAELKQSTVAPSDPTPTQPAEPRRHYLP